MGIFLWVLPRAVFRTQAKVYGGVFCKNSSWLLAGNYFRKKAQP